MYAIRSYYDSTLKTCYGSTTSTEIENSMSFYGAIDIYEGNQLGRTYQNSTFYNKAYAALHCYVDGYRGYSQFEYYVNGAYKHTSTAPFYFDFT